MPSMRKRLLGPHRERRLDRRARADPEPDAQQRQPLRDARGVQDDRAAGRPDGVTLNTLLPGRISTDRLYELYGSRDTADEVAIQEIPARRLGEPRGVRRRGRVPVLGAGQLHHRRRRSRSTAG